MLFITCFMVCDMEQPLHTEITKMYKILSDMPLASMLTLPMSSWLLPPLQCILYMLQSTLLKR